MKICNNCNHQNEITAEKCCHCNMPGNFTLHAVPTEARPIEVKTKIGCTNCGSHDPGLDVKCRHCHFPLGERGKVTPITDRTGSAGTDSSLSAHG